MYATFFALTCAPAVIARPKTDPTAGILMPVNIQLSKIDLISQEVRSKKPSGCLLMTSPSSYQNPRWSCQAAGLWRDATDFLVGLGRIELPTSPLSGVRSSHLSYRPRLDRFSSRHSGGAGRDRTGDLLNANQALSQLSYSPMKPPAASLIDEDKAGVRLLEINRGQLDAETTRPAHGRFS